MKEQCVYTDGQQNLFGETIYTKSYNHKWKDATRPYELSARSQCIFCHFISLYMWDYLQIKAEKRKVSIDVSKWVRILAHDYGENMVAWCIKK